MKVLQKMMERDKKITIKKSLKFDKKLKIEIAIKIKLYRFRSIENREMDKKDNYSKSIIRKLVSKNI